MSTLPSTVKPRPATIVEQWPRAGSPEFERIDGEWRTRVRGWMEEHPREPRSCAVVSACRRHTQRGGFHSEFGSRWQRLPERQRLLEHQARQTRSLARLGSALPSQTWMAEQATAALAYLRHTYWDAEEGGLFELVDVAGRPLMGETKHGHGAAYAIGAAAETHRLTGAPEALDFALEIFTWVDDHLYDTEHGGYHGWATRAGRPILSTTFPGS